MNPHTAAVVAPTAAAVSFLPHQENTMELTYEGYCADTILGQVSGADPSGHRLVAVAATFDAHTNHTRVTFVPLPLDTELERDPVGLFRVSPDRIRPDGTIAPVQRSKR